MKKIAILSISFLLAMSVTMGQTQNTAMVKKNEPKKEMKTGSEPLRKLEGKIIHERVKAKIKLSHINKEDVSGNNETSFCFLEQIYFAVLTHLNPTAKSIQLGGSPFLK